MQRSKCNEWLTSLVLGSIHFAFLFIYLSTRLHQSSFQYLIKIKKAFEIINVDIKIIMFSSLESYLNAICVQLMQGLQLLF